MWKKWKAGLGNGFFLTFLMVPQIYWGVTPLWRPAGSSSEWGQIQILVPCKALVKSVLVWNLALHNTATFLLEGKDCALGQDMLASHRCQCLCQHNQRASPLHSHPHCTVQALGFYFWPGVPFLNHSSLHGQSAPFVPFLKHKSA